MRAFLGFVFALALAVAPAAAFSPVEIATVTPAYQAPGWTNWTPAAAGEPTSEFWHADDTSTGAVSAWAGRIASASLAQATGSLQPVSAATSFNSTKRGVTCDGVDDDLRTASFPSVPSGASPVEQWLLVQQLVASSNASALTFADVGANVGTTRRTLLRVVSGANRVRAASNGVNVTDASVDFSGPHVVAGIWTATTGQTRIDGRDSPTSALTLSTGTSNVTLCASATATASGFTNIVTRIFVITSGLLTSAQHLKMDGYFAWQGGIPYVLPYNHPYRFRAP